MLSVKSVRVRMAACLTRQPVGARVPRASVVLTVAVSCEQGTLLQPLNKIFSAKLLGLEEVVDKSYWFIVNWSVFWMPIHYITWFYPFIQIETEYLFLSTLKIISLIRTAQSILPTCIKRCLLAFVRR